MTLQQPEPTKAIQRLRLRDEIASWFERQRVRFRAVASRMGIPDSVIVPVPVLDLDNGGGASGSYRDFTLSPVAISDWSLALERAAPDVLDDDSIALAKAMKNYAGHGIQFYTFLGLAFVAQRLRDPSVLGPEEEPDDLAFGLQLLYRALWTHLGSVHDLATDGTLEATRRADEVLEFVDGETWTTVTSIPVAGIIPSPLPLEVGQVRIRPLAPEEAAQLYPGMFPTFHRLPGGRFAPHPRRWWNGENVVIEVRSRQSKMSAPSAPPMWKKLVLAFQLRGFALTGPGIGYGWQEPEWLSVGTFESPVYMASRADAEARPLTAEGLGDLIRVAEVLSDAAVTTPDNPNDVALNRYFQAASRELPSDALVDSVVTLEGLLLSGIRDTRELSYRFSLNGAAYLSASADQRSAVYDKLRDLYQLRSRVVHGGGRLPATDQIVAAASQARQLAAAGLVRALEEGWPTQKKFLELLLSGRAP